MDCVSILAPWKKVTVTRLGEKVCRTMVACTILVGCSNEMVMAVYASDRSGCHQLPADLVAINPFGTRSPAAKVHNDPSASKGVKEHWRKSAINLLQQANEKIQSGEVGAAHNLTDEATALVKERVTGQDVLLADCLMMDGRIQLQERNLGLAEDAFKQALEIRRQLLKPADPMLKQTIEEYAALLDKMERKPEADKMREELAKISAKERVSTALNTNISGTAGGDSLVKVIELAKEATGKGDRDASLAQWKLALATVEKHGANDPRISYCLLKLADEYLLKKDYTAAEQALKRGLELLKSSGNGGSLCMAMTLRRLGNLAIANKDGRKAEELFSEALDISKKRGCDPRLIASTMQQLASSSVVAKDLPVAEQTCKQLQEFSNQLTGVCKQYAVLTSTSSLASIYMQSGKAGEGAALMRQIQQPQDMQQYAKQLAAEFMEVEKQADEQMYQELKKK